MFRPWNVSVLVHSLPFFLYLGKFGSREVEGAMMHRFGLTIAGGGARGAHTAGVLRFLLTEFPRNFGQVPWPRVVSGTSVGALNGYFAACHDDYELKRMTKIWTEMKTSDVYNLPGGGTLSLLKKTIQSVRLGALISNEPLRELILREASRRNLRKSILAGKCQAFIVSATHLTSGTNVLFVDSADPDYWIEPPPHGRVVYTKIYPRHLLASIAIPVVFPPERIAGKLYVDGGVRQSAPVQPMLESGMDRIVVLSTASNYLSPIGETDPEPSISLISGKALDALSLDPVDRDTRVTEKINKIIRWGTEKYGDGFRFNLQEELGIRELEMVHLGPSMDLGRLAVEVFEEEKIEGSTGAKWLLNKMYQQGEESGESDLLSHLLFDRCYTAEAEALGFRDAKAQEESLARLFTR